MRILFVAAEMAPLVKVGGMGDVVGALPAALRALGHDVRVLLPCYSHAMARGASEVARLPGRGHVLLALQRDDLACPVWLLRTPALLRRGGRPYADADGRPWPDDATVFSELARAGARLADGRVVADWRADVVHCHDWHSGLTPVWMLQEGVRAASVFTIHNLACQGHFPPAVLDALGLPGWLHHPAALEFHGSVAYIKGGLVFAQQLTTVSPGYAEEILQPAEGYGLDGLLRYRRQDLHGILNGIDEATWSPRTDAFLTHRYSARDLAGKTRERSGLMKALKLDAGGDPPPVLIGWVNRLTRQKGADLMIEALPALLELPVRVAMLASGEADLQDALAALARAHPGRLAVRSGFDEALAHRIYAASDLFLMPSRFEPCGLSQMYAMRYGAVPVVRGVGGLRDTVTDIDEDEGGTGVVFAADSATALIDAVRRALAARTDAARWQGIVTRGMGRSFSWRRSARAYERVYRRAVTLRGS